MIVEQVNTNFSALEIYEILLSNGVNDILFFDSSDKGSSSSQYSFIFGDPFYKFTSHKDPFIQLKNLLTKFSLPKEATYYQFPIGAIAGYLSYDTGFFIEKIKTATPMCFHWPTAEFGLYDFQIVFDHSNKKTYFVSTGLPEKNHIEQHKKAKKRIEFFRSLLSKKSHIESPETLENKLKLSSNFTKLLYRQKIKKIKSYIEQGDVYQVNFSQQFSTEFYSDPFLLYKKIRTRNHIPFGAYLDFGKRKILSFSMERFLKIKQKHVESKPIKGTIKRGDNSTEDSENAKKLLSSKKDIAELIMIVDLVRNDLGKICEYGSVNVKKLYELEKYATVFHLVATVSGILRDNVSPVDCVRSCFPGGSITGAPKIRSMEIIEELEKTRRSLYCGSIGYFGFNGISDFNIAIRTILINGKKLSFGSGGGITYDSEPEQEYLETIHKVRTFLEVSGYDSLY